MQSTHTQGVKWVVLKNYQTVSQAVVHSFPFKNNFRPPQPLNGRAVIQSSTASLVAPVPTSPCATAKYAVSLKPALGSPCAISKPAPVAPVRVQPQEHMPCKTKVRATRLTQALFLLYSSKTGTLTGAC